MRDRLRSISLGLVTGLSLILAACGGPPAAPALSDPKEIVTKAVTSLEGVKSFEFTGTFSGTVAAGQTGTFDLSTVKMAGAVDLASQTAKFSLDAPSVLGTKIDALVVDGNAYYKVAGAAALALGGVSDKYQKVPVPTGATNPVTSATDMAKLVPQIEAAIAQLPVQPSRANDDRCSDQDCYHVTLTMSAAQLQSLGAGTSGVDGSFTIDLFTRKSDYRPGRIAVSVASTQIGTVGMALDLKYDVSVSVQAPPADQIAQ